MKLEQRIASTAKDETAAEATENKREPRATNDQAGGGLRRDANSRIRKPVSNKIQICFCVFGINVIYIVCSVGLLNLCLLTQFVCRIIICHLQSHCLECFQRMKTQA